MRQRLSPAWSNGAALSQEWTSRGSGARAEGDDCAVPTLEHVVTQGSLTQAQGPTRKSPLNGGKQERLVKSQPDG